jgi:chromosome segregation ATPase
MSVGITYEQLMQTIHETNLSIRELSKYSDTTEKNLKEITETLKKLSEESQETKEAINEFWKYRQENERIRQESEKIRRENERIRQEDERIQRETAKVWNEEFEQVKAQFAETAARMRETDKQIGKLSNRFGDLAEHLVAPGIADRFNELGYHFENEFPGGLKIKNDRKQVIAQIDILLENDESIAAVEVKVCPEHDDIQEHIDRIEVFQNYRKTKGFKHKTIIGGIAGAIFPQNIKNAVIKAGLYVITQSGDTMKIEIPENFKPRKF